MENILIKTDTSEPRESCGLLGNNSCNIPLKPDSDQTSAGCVSTPLIIALLNSSNLTHNDEVKPWLDDGSKGLPNSSKTMDVPSLKVHTNHSCDSLYGDVGARPTPQISVSCLPSRSATKRKVHECSGDGTTCTGLPHQIDLVAPHDESDPYDSGDRTLNDSLKHDPSETSAECRSITAKDQTSLIKSNTLPNCDPSNDVMIDELHDDPCMLSVDTNDSCDAMYDDVAEGSTTTLAAEKPYACNVCSFRSASSSSLKKHMRTHTGVRIFACHECSYRATESCTLKIHLRKHTGEKPYVCNVCGFSASNSSRLTVHMRTHTGEKPYACNVCSFSAANSSRLKIHMRSHTGERPYACNACSFRAADPSSYKKHMRTHTGEKPFACDKCSYTAALASTLKCHMATHTGDKSYACDECDFKCSWAKVLKSHKATHAGLKTFTCNECNYRTTDSASLKIHARIHPGEKPVTSRM